MLALLSPPSLAHAEVQGRFLPFNELQKLNTQQSPSVARVYAQVARDSHEDRFRNGRGSHFLQIKILNQINRMDDWVRILAQEYSMSMDTSGVFNHDVLKLWIDYYYTIYD